MPRKIDNKWVFTEEELDEQIRRAEASYDEYIEGKPIATNYRFDPATRIVSIRTNDGSRIDFPIWKIRELQNASDAEVKDAYITKAGDAIHWDNLDAHYTIAGLAANIFGTKEWMQELGRKGGSAVSERKSAAARKNGARGGRPRKERYDHHYETSCDLCGNTGFSKEPKILSPHLSLPGALSLDKLEHIAEYIFEPVERTNLSSIPVAMSPQSSIFGKDMRILGLVN
jgi:hypothetical protein